MKSESKFYETLNTVTLNDCEYFQDLALAYSKHVKPEDHSAYEEFIEARNEVALDVGFVSTVVIPGSVRSKNKRKRILQMFSLFYMHFYTCSK